MSALTRAVVTLLGRFHMLSWRHLNGRFRRNLDARVLVDEGPKTTEAVEKRAIGGVRRAVFPGDDGRGAR